MTAQLQHLYWATKDIFSLQSVPDTTEKINVLAIKEGELIRYDPLTKK